MRKLIVLLISLTFFVSCSKDDDNNLEQQCMICDSYTGLDITQNELSVLCVGLTGIDEDTGEEVTYTKSDLDSMASLINVFAALLGETPNCRVE